MSTLVIAALVMIVKSTAAALVALAVDAWQRRRRIHHARGLVAMSGFLILLPIVTTLGPSVSPPLVRLPHAIVAMPASARFPSVSVASVMLGLWLVGVLYSFARLVHGLRAAQCIVRAATFGDSAGLNDTARRAAAAVGFRGALPLIGHTASLRSPAVVGWRRPVILLPDDAVSWPQEELLGVLCHELSHVARRDGLCRLLEEIATALYWPNPLLRIVWRRAALRRELAADRAALGAGVSPSEYATRLIAVARACIREQPTMSLAFVSAHPTDLSIRVTALFASPPQRTGVEEFAGMALVVATAVLLTVSQPIKCVPATLPTASASQL